MKYQVSIILPVYNAEKTLVRCIDSLLAQTFKDFEIILIDDGSEDNSGKLCDSYANNHRNIQVLHQANKGVSHARNAGIQMASSKLIQFADADDTVSNNFVSSLYNAISKNEADMAICGYSEIYEEQNARSIVIDKPLQASCFMKQEFLNLFGQYFYDYTIHYIWNKIYDADIIRDNHIQFHGAIGGDLPFNLDYFAYCEKLCMIPESLYQYYKLNAQSITTIFRRKDLASTQKEYVLGYKFLNDNNAYTKMNKAYLDAFYLRNLSSYISMLYHPDSDFTKKEKKDILRGIVNDQDIRFKFLNSSMYANKLIRLIAPLVKIRSTGSIAFVYKIVARLKNNRGSLFSFLKRWAMK